MNKQLIFFLLTLKNAAIYKKQTILIAYHNEYLPLLDLLYKEGYIQTFSINKDNNNKSTIKIVLRSYNNIFALSELKLISKPSCVRNVQYKHLTDNIYDIRKTFFITTNKGIKTQVECKQDRLGGSLVFTC